MKSIFVIPFALAILAVPNIQAEKVETLKVLNSGGELYQKWHSAVERMCTEETDNVAYAMALANKEMTENDFNKLRDMLMFTCSKHYNIAF